MVDNLRYKFRIYPTPAQEQELVSWAGVLRWVWNYMLGYNNITYQMTGKFRWYHEMATELPQLKKYEALEWLKSVPAQATQHQCKILHNTLMQFCKDKKNPSKKNKNGYPKFKSKKDKDPSIYIPVGKDQIEFTDKYISIPKLGQIKWKPHRSFDNGTVTSIEILKDGNRWFVSCMVKEPKQVHNYQNHGSVGIDMGIKEFAVTSDGEIFENKKFLANSEKKLKKMQRKASKARDRLYKNLKVRTSRNQKKRDAKVAKIHQKIRNQRLDYNHKISRQIANAYSSVCIETLSISNMLKNHKLAKAIADCGWRQFIDMLIYKMEMRGGTVIFLDRWFPSSKTCSRCGHIHSKLTLNDRTFKCPHCHLEIDRDLNAAINLLRAGMARLVENGIEVIPGQMPVEIGDSCFLEEMYEGQSVKQEIQQAIVGSHVPLGAR